MKGLKDFSKLALAAMLGAGLVFGAGRFFPQVQTVYVEGNKQDVTQQVSYRSPAGTAEMASLDFSDVAEKVTPAVVHIKSKVMAEPQGQQGLPFMFREFFGDRDMRPSPSEGSGSGVIVSADGYIVTNNHVIDKATEIEVVLNDKRTYKAEVVGTDPTTDIAVIKIKDKGLPTLGFGNSDEVRVGQWVLAVGNPFNLASTVTAGIVSAKGRSINILRENYAIESFIQTDAAVNPGNSGGALVDTKGLLVGINTAIASPTGSYSGYSFAVPANIVEKVVDDLMKFGKVQRAYLGIFISNLDAAKAGKLKLPISEGVHIDSLMNDGSAFMAGMKKGDVIAKVDGRKVRSVADLQENIGRKRPGESVSVAYFRNGKEQTMDIRLKNREGGTELVKAAENKVLRSLGAEFENLTAAELKDLGLRAGVKVGKLSYGKLRSSTQINEGFIITKVNRQPVGSAEDLVKLLENEKGGILLEGVYPDNPDNVLYYGFGM